MAQTVNFNVGDLPAYTDQLSMPLLAKSILNTDLLQYTDLKTDMTSGIFSINLVDTTLPITALDCGGFLPNENAGVSPDGQVIYTQVNVTIDALQSKTTLCPEILRSKYVSAYLQASTMDANSYIPLEEIISESYSMQVTKATENYLINGAPAGAGTGTGLKAQMIAGATTVAGAVPFAVTTALASALDIYDAVDESVINRDDIIMVVSPANYRILVRDLVAANLYHFDTVAGNEILYLPGTNCKVVMSSGLVGSQNVFCGPSKMIIVGTGLADELTEGFKFTYSNTLDAMLFAAKFRIGVGVGQVNLFATNGLA